MSLFSVLIFVSLLLVFAYATVMLVYLFGWKKLPEFQLNSILPKTKFTIIIPARNEIENIGNCLESILANNYPKELFEIIVVDDFSEDETVGFLEKNYSNSIKLIQLVEYVSDRNSVNSFKKKAIEIAILNSKNELILTTDADCICPTNWLKLIDQFYQQNKFKMLAAPVNFYKEMNALERFQSLDFMGLMGITGAGISGRWQRMANGANLCFSRKNFDEIGGYTGIDNLASGDDMLLMQKMAARWPDGIFFLKNRLATVVTRAKSDWPGFVSQRLRWASKSAIYPEWRVTAVLAVVFLFCLNLVVLATISLFFGWQWGVFLLFQLAVKALFDFLFLRMMARFFSRDDLLRAFWPSFFLHIFYIVVVGTASQFVKKYAWKGRVVR